MSKKSLVEKYEAQPLPGNPRLIEAWGLTQAALRMRDAQQDGDVETLRAAARLNWRLWTILQSELLSPDCPLPDDIRSNALSLANFVDKHTVSFISDPKPEKLDVLVNINRELASGLYAEPPSDENAPEPSDQGGGGQTPPAGLGGGDIIA